jgi:hypothetical protein
VCVQVRGWKSAGNLIAIVKAQACQKAILTAVWNEYVSDDIHRTSHVDDGGNNQMHVIKIKKNAKLTVRPE